MLPVDPRPLEALREELRARTGGATGCSPARRCSCPARSGRRDFATGLKAWPGLALAAGGLALIAAAFRVTTRA